MYDYDKVRVAKALAAYAHQGQRYGDHDYFLAHIEKVVDAVAHSNIRCITDDVICVAYLHDMLEDTDITYDTIENIFGHEIAHSVIILTKNNKQLADYEYYLTCVARYPIATVVKLADLECNMNACLRDGDTKRADKYKQRLDYLKGLL